MFHDGVFGSQLPRRGKVVRVSRRQPDSTHRLGRDVGEAGQDRRTRRHGRAVHRGNLDRLPEVQTTICRVGIQTRRLAAEAPREAVDELLRVAEEHILVAIPHVSMELDGPHEPAGRLAHKLRLAQYVEPRRSLPSPSDKWLKDAKQPGPAAITALDLIIDGHGVDEVLHFPHHPHGVDIALHDLPETMHEVAGGLELVHDVRPDAHGLGGPVGELLASVD